jgi:hypothetical protein
MLIKMPNGHVLKFLIYQHFLIQGPPNYTKIGIFGLKTNHLATLTQTCSAFFKPILITQKIFRAISFGFFCLAKTNLDER